MQGMDEVGRLFNDNQLIVAEVLQSAEAMKAAVAHLEPFMEKAESAPRAGTIVLATVKGDVHDIGKNLVEIILSNNGYRVINLGHQGAARGADRGVPRPQAGRLRAVRPAREVRAADGGRRRRTSAPPAIEIPLFVGGAALTRKFTATRIAAEYGGLTLYAKDAMDGLDLANQLFSAPTRDAPRRAHPARAGRRWPRARRAPPRPRRWRRRPRRHGGSTRVTAPAPPDLERHVLRDVPLAHIYPYLNLQMLYGKHLGPAGARRAPAGGGRPEGASRSTRSSRR